jgi:uncharacterized protein with GYD domain
MAKRSEPKSAFDEKKIVYFLLVSLTSKGRSEERAIIREDQRRVTELVNQLGGSCELFSTQGPYDFISRIEGIPAVGAIRILQAIESAGNVKAHLVPAFHILK